jgi:GDP-L-fucose synthase
MFKKVIVTGGTGLLGTGMRNAANLFPNTEFFFLGSKDCNLINLEATLDSFSKYSADGILHFAALSGGIHYSTNYPATLLRDNVLMNFNVLEAARKLQISKVVMSLSVGMYPVEAPIPLKEEYIHNGKPHSSNLSYAFAKRLVDPSIQAYRKEYGMNVIGVVPNGIFGENMNYKYDESIMLAALIRRFYENRNSEAKLEVWGDGTPLREYTYSQDMAKAYMWCLENYNDSQFLNIGSTEEHSIKETAILVAKNLSIDADRLYFNTDKPNGIFRRSTDNSKFISLSDFKYTPFNEALEKTISWFMDNYEKPGVVRL